MGFLGSVMGGGGGFSSPQPANEAPKSPTTSRIGNVKSTRFPTNEGGKGVPVLYGRHMLTGIYYSPIFNEVADPIYQKRTVSQTRQSGKGTTTTTQTIKEVVGYNYRLSWAMGLCCTRTSKVLRVMEGDETIWTGEATPDADGYASIDTDNGVIHFYFGFPHQAVDTLLGHGIAYRHQTYYVTEDYFVGENTQPPTLRFELEGQPQLLTGYTNGIEGDANIAAVLYELLLDPIRGVGLDASKVDLDSFTAAAQRCVDLDLGISPIVEDVSELRDEIISIATYGNMSLVYDYGDGKIRLNMEEDSVAPENTISIGVDDLLEEPELTPSSWEETWNVTRVTFSDREREYEEDQSPYFDSANLEIRGRTIQKEFDRSFITRKSVADTMVEVLSRQGAMPLARGKLKLKSTISDIEPGAIIDLSYPKLGITSYYMAVREVRVGSPDEPGLDLEVTEHISRVKTVQPLDLGPIIVHDPLRPAGIPTAGKTVVDTTAVNALAPYFRIGALTQEMREYEAVEVKADGFLVCMRRPNAKVVGGAIYYAPATTDQFRLMNQLTQFPIYGNVLSYSLPGSNKCLVTVRPWGTWDASNISKLKDNLDDVYLATGRMIINDTTAPVVKHDVTPMVMKLVYQGTFEQNVDGDWEIEFEMGAFGTTALGGSLGVGESEYMTRDAFMGFADALGIVRNDNLKFLRSGGNFTGDTELRRFIRTLTYTPTEFGIIGNSEYVYLDQDDTTMSAEGSFGVLTKDGDASGDPGWWGVAAVNDYAIRILTDGAIGFWRLGEASGNAKDETLTQDGTVAGTPTRSETGALTGDADNSYAFDGVDDIVEADYGASTVPASARSVEAWIKVPAVATPVDGQETICELPGGWGLYVEWGILKARNYNGLLEYNTSVWVADGEWHHVCLTWDNGEEGGNALAFIDGQLAGWNDLLVGDTPDDRVDIGGYKETNVAAVTNAFEGHLDEVALFSKKLNPDEVVSHYEAGLDIWN